jgi:hypothetical protein
MKPLCVDSGLLSSSTFIGDSEYSGVKFDRNIQYIRSGVALNLEHFWQRATESGDWSETSITKKQLLELLHAKINTTKIENAK